MAKYVCLVTFTDTGIKNLKTTAKRAKAFEKGMTKQGVKVITTLWTVGSTDLVHIFEAEDDEVAAIFAYTLCSYGNVRTNTMRAFDADEIEGIIRDVQTPYDLIREGEPVPSSRPSRPKR